MSLPGQQPGSPIKSCEINPARKDPDGRRLAHLSLAALGVVFGDIATSPLYAIRECFHGEFAIAVTPANVLGVLSLVFWSLMLVVSLKYLTFILRADNNGEGGVLALTALVKGKKRTGDGQTPWYLITIGLFAACLLYGDGMITPAISVLSAVEGIRIITPVFQPYIEPLTIVVLGGLFLLQRRGTERVGRLFGPIILVWLGTLALLGAVQIWQHPEVLWAISPGHGLTFLVTNKLRGFLVLGAVFLVATGAEALYADLGHFGRRPIRLTWFSLVLPALVLNYFGQGALLISRPEESHHPFYGLVPAWGLIPMVVLATLATIIASQAVITGSFSLTRQAVQMGYLPRLRITHTSAGHIGQIYIAPVNWILMLCTIGLVLGFQSSSNLAAAYGMAVTSTMLITTCLFFRLVQKKWGWSLPAASLLAGLFLLAEIPFFSANIIKIFHGAWFPLLIAGIFFTLMLTWEQGRTILAQQIATLTPSFADFKKNLEEEAPHKIRGQAIFLTGNPNVVPATLIHNVHHNKVLHAETVFLHIINEDVPRVPNFDKVEFDKLGGGFYQLRAHYGFMEDANIQNILALAHEQGFDYKLDKVSFFLGRQKLITSDTPKMGRWRSGLFIFLSQNAMDAAAFFDIPPDQVIEVGVQLQL